MGNNNGLLLILVVGIWVLSTSKHPDPGVLDEVADDALIELLKINKYVIVLFAKDDCKLCDEYENMLSTKKSAISNELDDVAIVKVTLSQLLRFYNPTVEPSIVFFRHGIPLLCNDPADSDELYFNIVNNKEPCLRLLTDATFEHLTQSATGATTGDWFIYFHNSECIECPKLVARIEAVCVKLKRRLNVASVNEHIQGIDTFKRFGINKVPAFILFRHGKMYRYPLQKFDVVSLNAFATEGYKNIKADDVPQQKSSLDSTLQSTMDYITGPKGSLILKLCSLLVAVSLVVLVAYRKSARIADAQKDKPKDTKEKPKEK